MGLRYAGRECPSYKCTTPPPSQSMLGLDMCSFGFLFKKKSKTPVKFIQYKSFQSMVTAPLGAPGGLWKAPPISVVWPGWACLP